MTPEHRATLTRLLAAVSEGPNGVADAPGPDMCADAVAALRAVLTVPEAGEVREEGAWESAEAFSSRHKGTTFLIQTRDAQTADRLAGIIDAVEDGNSILLLDFIRDLRGLPR